MRGRSSACSHSSRVRSNAFSAARLAPSPIACTATARPQALASATASASSSSRQQLLAAMPSSIHAVRDPSVPSMNAFTGPTVKSSLPKPVRSSIAPAAPDRRQRNAHGHAQGQPAVGVVALPQTRGRPGPGSRAPRSRRARWPRPCPRAAPASAAATWPAAAGTARPPTPQHAGGVLGAGGAQRRAVHPQRVVVVSPQRGRPLAGDRVQRAALWRAVRPGRLQPALAAQPAVTVVRLSRLRRSASARLRQPCRSSQRALERPVQEVDVGVGEAWQHAAPVEVDPLVADGVGVALADVHAARNQRRPPPPARAPAADADPSCRSGRCGGSSGR